MAWETRAGSGRYYTRSQRVNGRIVREYVGQGPFAELAHLMDADERNERDAKRKAFEAVLCLDAERDKQLESFIELSEAVASGLLILAGYHLHKRGNWRKRNEQDQE